MQCRGHKSRASVVPSRVCVVILVWCLRHFTVSLRRLKRVLWCRRLIVYTAVAYTWQPDGIYASWQANHWMAYGLSPFNTSFRRRPPAYQLFKPRVESWRPVEGTPCRASQRTTLRRDTTVRWTRKGCLCLGLSLLQTVEYYLHLCSLGLQWIQQSILATKHCCSVTWNNKLRTEMPHSAFSRQPCQAINIKSRGVGWAKLNRIWHRTIISFK